MNYNPFIKGVCIGVVLAALGVESFTGRWWISMLAMNIMVSC